MCRASWCPLKNPQMIRSATKIARATGALTKPNVSELCIARCYNVFVESNRTYNFTMSLCALCLNAMLLPENANMSCRYIQGCQPGFLVSDSFSVAEARQHTMEDGR